MGFQGSFQVNIFSVQWKLQRMLQWELRRMLQSYGKYPNVLTKDERDQMKIKGLTKEYWEQ